MHIDKRLLHLLQKIKSKFYTSIALSTLEAGMIIVQAWILSIIIKDVFLGKESLADVYFLLLIFLSAVLFRAIFGWSSKRSTASYTESIKNDLSEQLYRHIQTLGPAFTSGEQSGEISNTLTNGIEALDAYFSKFLPHLFLSALIPLLILLFVFPMDILSGLVFLFTAPLIPFFMQLIGEKAEDLNKKQWKILSRMSAHFMDVLQGLSTLKMFNQSLKQKETISKISNDFRLSTMKVLKIAFLSALVLEVLSTISIAIIAVEIGLRLLYDKMIFQEAFFILVLAPEFYLPIRQLGIHYHAGMEGVAAANRIFEILETEPKTQKIPYSEKWQFKNEEIHFKNISFSYSEGRAALDNVTLSIKPFQKTALIGPSGSGKTTLSKMLLRFINPDSGGILIGETLLENINPKEWEKQIAWVSQNPYIFNASIEENIRIAKNDATHEEIREAAKLAHIDDFIRSLPEKYKTIAGENGTRLSGGQAQRIALARAFLKDAPIIILDEPTANLDPIAEQRIAESVNQLVKDKAVLIIAHRFNTIASADFVVVLDKGKVSAQGTHQSLMKSSPFYKQIIAGQV